VQAQNELEGNELRGKDEPATENADTQKRWRPDGANQRNSMRGEKDKAAVDTDGRFGRGAQTRLDAPRLMSGGASIEIDAPFDFQHHRTNAAQCAGER
jgi:hypothetical protein